MSRQPVEKLQQSLPERFAVSLIMQRSPAVNPWAEAYWEAVGMLAGGDSEKPTRSVDLIREEAGVSRYLHRGFTLHLHADECESYYHNLLAPSPCCYVVATAADDGPPQPLLLTLSFDEAHAYLEADATLYTVPMPPEIYRWAEAYVLRHYVPQRRSKRKRRDWREDEKARRP